ncbi:MAG: Gfo/Idh/MocA family oxidoreductase [Alphaproteobacteria bacterium]|nr:Gfo/Idh/MocA family oxidoreductase [Alphaproteobacteria bacterium]
MGNVRFGIVGTGFIAGVIANAITKAENADLVAVSSRRLATAEEFVAERQGVAAVEGFDALVSLDAVEAVYIATPTTTKEALALSAIEAGKHILVDKPLASAESVKRIVEAAEKTGVLFMDATHFVHHPRTDAIKAHKYGLIGDAKSLHTTFYFPFDDRANIRFDRDQEPMTALGDMAWYSMRAAVEYLQPRGMISKKSIVVENDQTTGAIVRASGLLGFESGETTTFDIGYTAGTAIMDLSLVGANGMISMDDFVLDWTNSFAFQKPDTKTGFVHRTGMTSRHDFHFIETPSKHSADTLMIMQFADLTTSDDITARRSHSTATLKTQTYLDAMWEASN